MISWREVELYQKISLVTEWKKEVEEPLVRMTYMFVFSINNDNNERDNDMLQWARVAGGGRCL